MAVIVRLVGVYELRKLLGRGPHGTVWHARDQSTGEHIAVKVLDAVFAMDPHVVNHFIREETALAAFVDPGYVRVQRLLLDDDYLALVTELVPGVDLERYLRISAPLPPETATRVAADCARIIAAGHRLGMVHGDVKPTNVLLVGKDREVRITDCRVTRLTRGARGSLARLTDPRYAAPEVIRNEPVVPATDVYGVGMLLFAMLTGSAMWGGVDAADPLRRPGCRSRLRQCVADERLRHLIAACVADDRDARPSAELLAAVLAPATPTVVVADPAPAAPPPAALAPPVAVVSPPHGAAPRPSLHAAAAAPPRRPLTDPRAAASAPAGRVGPPRARIPVPRLIGHGGALAAALALAAVAGVGLAALHADPRGAGRSAAASAPAMTSTIVATLPAPPQVPRSASSETADGAGITGRYWFDTLNYAVGTGNIGALQAASDPVCDACTAIEKAVSDAYRAGGSMRGGQYVVRSMNLDSFFNLQRASLRVVFDRSPRTTVDATGRERAALAEATFAPCQIVLNFAGGQWRVLAVQATDPVG
jgi:serine/threonine-protein kinase